MRSAAFQLGIALAALAAATASAQDQGSGAAGDATGGQVQGGQVQRSTGANDRGGQGQGAFGDRLPVDPQGGIPRDGGAMGGFRGVPQPGPQQAIPGITDANDGTTDDAENVQDSNDVQVQPFGGAGALTGGFRPSHAFGWSNEPSTTWDQSWSHGSYSSGLSAERARASAWALAPIERQVRAAEAFYYLRRLNEESRDARRRSRPSTETLNRWAKEALPDRLEANEFDPVYQTIRWPAVLRTARFEDDRLELQQLFTLRTAHNSGVGTENFDEVREATDSMRTKLDAAIETVHPESFIQGAKFLRSLAYEARFVPDNEGFASRP